MSNKVVSEDRIGVTEHVLRVLETGVRIIGVMMDAPSMGYMLYQADQIHFQMEKKYMLHATIRRLEKQKYIAWEQENGETVLVLKQKRKKKINDYNIKKIKLNKPKKWDGMYRVIIFDIPEQKKYAREALRLKLKELEFHKLQKSVFVTPYECKDEVDFLSSVYGIGKYVQYLLVKDIPNINPNLWML